MNRHQSCGFTLLEILIALAIVALVFTSLFAVFDKVMDVAGHVEQRKNVVQTGRLVLMRLNADLGSLLQPEENEQKTADPLNATAEGSWKAFRGESLPESGLDAFANATVLSFATSSGLEFNSTWPGHSLYRVTYIIEPVEQGEERYRLLRRQTQFPYLDAAQMESLELCRNLSELEIQFHTGDETLPQLSWNTDAYAEEEQPIPAAVAIRFTLQDESGSERFSLFKTLESF